MDSTGVKYSGGKLVSHSDLRTGTASGGSKNRNKKDLRIGTWNVRTLIIPNGRSSGGGTRDREVRARHISDIRSSVEGSR